MNLQQNKRRVQTILKYAQGVPGLRSDDVFLVSYPKSGNTWVRFLLGNVISLEELAGKEVDFNYLDVLMPSLGLNNLLQPWPYDALPRFVKTHQAYRPVVFSRPRRVVFISRDPRDTMVSYFHYAQSSRSHRGFSGDFSSFIRHPYFGLRSLFEHYRSWQARVDYLIRFEDLKVDPADVLQDLVAYTGRRIPDSTIDEAVARSSFSNLKDLRSKHGAPRKKYFMDSYNFLRKGTSKQWRDYFSSEDLLYFEELAHGYDFPGLQVESLPAGVELST